MTRPTQQQRGYGPEHIQERRRWQQILTTEQIIPCARCHQPIHHGDPWDLGHTDDRTTWTGPEHVHCNRSAGGKNGARTTNLKRQLKQRAW